MTTPFSDLDAFQAIPRTGGLALSPDGTRLVTSVATLNSEATKWVNALWEIDPTGEQPATRLTRSRKGEASPAFLPNGDLLFTSARPDPDAKDDKPTTRQRRSGCCRPAAARPAWWAPGPGGVGGVVVAKDAGTVLVSSATLPGAVTGEDDEKRRKERKDKKVKAILHTGYPVRYWDHDLGPDAPRLLTGIVDEHERITWDDRTPTPGRALDEASYDISADGATIVTSWSVAESAATRRSTLAVIDGAGQRVLLDDQATSTAARRSRRTARSSRAPARLTVTPTSPATTGSSSCRSTAPPTPVS